MNPFAIFAAAIGLTFLPPSSSVSAEIASKNSLILVEIVLSQGQEGDLDLIKEAFGVFSITKVRAQFLRLGRPPRNIGIGRNVSADVGRLAIRLAIQHNRGIEFLLPEMRLAENYIAIGASIFDEFFQVKVAPQEVQRLLDPALTTDAFHLLYRSLTGEDKPKR